mmetsp:Transcript_22098/g.34001  ORF Transcript_22098/g.34001 Transcript_22098/m.34001 type:complete len:337 (-) Transcript_22098:2139-3149(-)
MGAKTGSFESCNASNANDERQFLQDKCDALRRKLQNIQKRRRAVKSLIHAAQDVNAVQLKEHRNEALCINEEAFSSYKSAVTRRKLVSSRLRVARTWNATNDCFHIWYAGPFGTINGLRLGSEIRIVAGTEIDEMTGKYPETTDTTGKTETQRYGLMFSSVSNTAEPTVANINNNPNGRSITDNNIKIPWVEINSALGIIALLLKTLEQKPHSCIQLKHEIIPMGSCSKIGLRRGDPSSVYNLHSDDSFQFFGKRNFNIALNTLLACLADAFAGVRKRDRTIALPHAIEIPSRGEATIGGLSIAFGNDGERWTRAMKFLLTDLKWLVAFTTKHVDR